MTQPTADEPGAAQPTDPYACHPELRGKITDPHTSFFSQFQC